MRKRERWSLALSVMLATTAIFGLMALIARWFLASRSLLAVVILALVGCSTTQVARIHDAATKASEAVALVKANGPATVDALEASVALVASQTGPLHEAATRAQAVIAAYRRNTATILDVELAVDALAQATAAATKPVGQ